MLRLPPLAKPRRWPARGLAGRRDVQRIALAVVIAMTGCSTTIRVQRPLTSESVTEVNSRLEGRNATVTYGPPGAKPQRDAASEITLTPEKARWTMWQSEFARDRKTPPGQRVEAPIDAVRKITYCDASCHAKGILEGAGVGFLLGGLVTGVVLSTCHSEYCYYALGIPIVPTLLGALIGGSGGHPTIVELEPPPRR